MPPQPDEEKGIGRKDEDTDALMRAAADNKSVQDTVAVHYFNYFSSFIPNRPLHLRDIMALLEVNGLLIKRRDTIKRL